MTEPTARVFACVNCGAEKFKAGVIEANEHGGFDLLMPCSTCNTMNVVLHDYDPELAQVLMDYFADQDSTPLAVQTEVPEP